jgi:hypothetical protein
LDAKIALKTALDRLIDRKADWLRLVDHRRRGLCRYNNWRRSQRECDNKS